MSSAQFIIITGPECTGKSTLSKALAEKYSLPWTEEIARWYLPALNREYNYEDLIDIARIEARKLLNHRYNSAGLVIADTWLLVMRVWMEYRYDKSEDWIKFLPKLYNDAHYLLCVPDIPWKSQPLRENPHDRRELYEIYKNHLREMGLNYTKIGGTEVERFQKGSEVVEKYL